jgi:TonB family protein
MIDRKALGVVAAGLVMAATAQAANRPPPSEANWARRPTPQEFREALAQVHGQVPAGGARAAMRCKVEDTGALSGCHVVLETPAGSGFGAALLALAPKYVRKPPGKNDLREVNVVFDEHPFDVGPDWLKRPTAGDLLAVWPTAAWKKGQGGKAVINCQVTVQGALNECVAVEETPGGFGGAAIALTPQLLMRPATLKGSPVVSVAQIPINFEGPGTPPPGGDTTFGSRKVVQPNLPWSLAPGYADVVAAYPRKARAAKIAGRATVDCDMTEEGRLAHCATVVVEPHGYGFDDAAKDLAKQFQFPVRSEAEKKATHGLSVHLPVTFDPAMLDQKTPPVVGKPSWAALPDAAGVIAAFSAVKTEVTARAMLSCTVAAGGGLTDCQVASEQPLGAGVGAAALSLAPTFRLTTWTVEGLPTIGGRVNVPIRYEPGPPK